MPAGTFSPPMNQTLEVFPARSCGGAFLEEVVEEGGHGDDRVGIDLVDDADVALGADGFPAAGGEHEGVVRGAGVVRLPEGEVGRERECVHVFVGAIRLAELHEPPPALLKAGDVIRGVEERNRRGGTAGGAGEEDGAEFLFERCLRVRRAGGDGSEEGAPFLFHGGLIGDDDEVARVFEIGLGGERQFHDVIGAPDIARIDADFGKHLPVEFRERHGASAQETP